MKNSDIWGVVFMISLLCMSADSNSILALVLWDTFWLGMMFLSGSMMERRGRGNRR